MGRGKPDLKFSKLLHSATLPTLHVDLVRMEGLEPPRPKALAPKASVATITPHPRNWVLPHCGGNLLHQAPDDLPDTITRSFHPLHDQWGLSHCQRRLGKTGTTLGCHATSHRAGHTSR